ncbi:MAG TPA: hypothetical protein VH206_01510 [Xanthobacteraceae bacterium]|jgi:hypothetical protein|nr:hypothetical protein [Xanthobacteraceae bacterium]
MLHDHHGFIRLSGIGLILNLIGLSVLALSFAGINRTNTPQFLKFGQMTAAVGTVLVVAGTLLVIESEMSA